MNRWIFDVGLLAGLVVGAITLATNANAAFVTVADFNANNRTMNYTPFSDVPESVLTALENDIAASAAAGMGGVINFELAQGSVTTPGQVIGNYGTGKWIELTGTYDGSVTNPNRFAQGTDQFATFFSGTQWLRSLNNVDVDLTISDPFAAIDRIAFALRTFSSSAADDDLDIEVFYTDANMNAQSATFNDIDYTFVGSNDPFLIDFQAPTGASIHGLAFTARQPSTTENRFFQIDDFAFTTSAVAVPEPASVAFIAMLSTATIVFRRKSRA